MAMVGGGGGGQESKDTKSYIVSTGLQADTLICIKTL